MSWVRAHCSSCSVSCLCNLLPRFNSINNIWCQSVWCAVFSWCREKKTRALSWRCSRGTWRWSFGVCRQRLPRGFLAANSWSAGQAGFGVCVCMCACVCPCRRVPRVVARCRSAGHVAPMWNCQRLPWQREGKQKLSAPGVRERWRRRNEAQTFSRILSTARCFSHTPAFSLSLIPSC